MVENTGSVGDDIEVMEELPRASSSAASDDGVEIDVSAESFGDLDDLDLQDEIESPDADRALIDAGEGHASSRPSEGFAAAARLLPESERMSSEPTSEAIEVSLEEAGEGHASSRPSEGFAAAARSVPESEPIPGEGGGEALEPAVEVMDAELVLEGEAGGDVEFLEVAEFDSVERATHERLQAAHDSLQSELERARDESAALAEELARVQAELRLSQQRLARVAADFDNFKRRNEREREEQRRLLTERVLLDMIPVNDNLERALGHVKSSDDRESLVQGVEMVQKQLVSVLARHGCEPFESVGNAFDPQRHEAIQQVESQQFAQNVVVEEYHRGYLIDDHLLRPALVVVSKGPGPSPSSETLDEEPIAVDPGGEVRLSGQEGQAETN